MVALLLMGSAILLFSCKSKQNATEESLDAIKTEESENLTIIMSENGRKSYLFKTPLLEGYTLGRDPYREFRKGISITTYQDDSLTTVNAVLVANYAIYYENRKLWEAKGDVVITKHDGTRLYTQQLFWNSITKRIYSNVDTKLVTETDEVVGEGFESDEEMNEPRFRRWKGRMQVDTEQLRNDAKDDDKAENKKSVNGKEDKSVEAEKSTVKQQKPQSKPVKKPQPKRPKPQSLESKRNHAPATMQSRRRVS
jgi:LPS export ABC transporter protein LptC